MILETSLIAENREKSRLAEINRVYGELQITVRVIVIADHGKAQGVNPDGRIFPDIAGCVERQEVGPCRPDRRR